MQIRHVLQQKGRDIIATCPTATIQDAAQLLAKKRIGALIVKSSVGGLAGILSERDVVRAIAAEGASALGREVAAYMTRSVATCTESDTVEDLMEMMTRGRFRHVPVLDEDQSSVRADLDRRRGEDPHRRNLERSQLPSRVYFHRHQGLGNFSESL